MVYHIIHHVAGDKQNPVLGAYHNISRQADGSANAAGAIESGNLAIPDGSWVYATVKHLNIDVLHLLQVSHTAPYHNAAVFRAGFDRRGQVAAHKGTTQNLIVQVADHHIIFFQAVNHPLVAVPFPAIAASHLEHVLAQIRALGHEAAGHGTTIQLFARMEGLQIPLKLKPVSAGIQRLPDFLLGKRLENLNFFITDFGSPVGITFPGPRRRHC